MGLTENILQNLLTQVLVEYFHLNIAIPTVCRNCFYLIMAPPWCNTYLERWVPHELSLDHERLDVVDGVHVVHGVDHHLTDLRRDATQYT